MSKLRVKEISAAYIGEKDLVLHDRTSLRIPARDRSSPGKNPAEVLEDVCIGNVEFNRAVKKSKIGYHIQGLWRLVKLITL